MSRFSSGAIACALSLMVLAGCGGNSDSNNQISPPAPSDYSIQGSVSGLSAGQSVTLTLNGGESTVVNGPASGSAAVPFSFTGKVAQDDNYAVAVSSIAAGAGAMFCPVTNGQGTASANVSNIAVDCHVPQPASVHGFINGVDQQINPTGGLLMDKQGNLYGTTNASPSGNGTVFELKANSDGSYTPVTLHAFTGSSEGNIPGGLVMDAHGNLFGTTQSGGDFNYGTVFALKPDSGGVYQLTTLHTFTNTGTDGANPIGSLVMDSQGNLFGTTRNGGTGSCMFGGCGVAFELQGQPDGSYLPATTLVSFVDGLTGRQPTGLTMDSQGHMFGTTQSGGPAGFGTVFQLTPQGGSYTVTTLYAFAGLGNGGTPNGNLVIDGQGNLFGTTQSSDTNGTAFRLKPNGDGSYTETTLHNFTGPDGATPLAGLVMDAQGNLFGTTSAGGSGYGTVFELKTNGDGTYSLVTLHAFTRTDGDTPNGALLLDGKGNLFGTTEFGGPTNVGSVFVLN
jgi:uncharacterized repeat protein (TIGR03803 family)